MSGSETDETLAPQAEAPEVSGPREKRPFVFQGQGHGLSEELFNKFADFVQTELGIKMPHKKKAMLEARLRKRMRRLGMESFEEYAEYAFGPEGIDEELHLMMDVVTTNKTEFFREPRHYEHLENIVLPDVLKRPRTAEDPLTLWSAGCSSGQEPYTLAMVLTEYAAVRLPGGKLDFLVLATDVSTEVLERAVDAIYPERTLAGISEEMVKKYFLRSKDRTRPTVRVCKEVRDRVRFGRMNFMEESYGVGPVDVVFFRNVMIYFNRPTQEAILNKLCQCLRPGGYLVLGHSETILGLKTPLRQVVNTVYKLD